MTAPASSTRTRITLSDAERAEFGDPTEHRIERDDDRPLAFRGWCIGEAWDKLYRTNNGNARDATRWTEVDIYLTTGGNLVIVRTHRTCWQGETDHRAAAIVHSPEEALACMRQDHDGTLGHASRLAWEDACKDVAALAPARDEHVE
jgi:hypothetical protein